MNRRQNWWPDNLQDDDFYTSEEKSFLNKRGLMSDTIDYLNDLAKIDPDAMKALFQPVFCNAKLANTPLVQAGTLGDIVSGPDSKQHWTSMMGILNGLLCCDEKTGYICRVPNTMEFDIVEPSECKGLKRE